MSKPRNFRQAAKYALQLPGALIARLQHATGRAPRFSQAFETRAATVASLPPEKQAGYDDTGIADVSFKQMCERQSWDYPLLFWMQRLLPETGVVLDAGGHLGTKYIAFSDLLDLSRTDWVVYDLPGIIAAARTKQAAGTLPSAISFGDDITALPHTDLLIASGLLQYLDISFSDFVAQLARPPKYILLNKVAVRSGPSLFTIERIGAGRVPYQIRAVDDWEQEITSLGYRIDDSWSIPSLSHQIATHPWLGRSESRGYLLVRRKGTP